MENKLHELIMNAQDNNEGAMIELVERFNPIVKKYSKMLNYDGAYTDLLIRFIIVIKNINI